MDVIERFAARQAQHPALRLYALIDGLAYEEHTGARLSAQSGLNRALFADTPDEPLAHAGPWLFDTTFIQDQLPALCDLEAARPAVSWLITAMELIGLSQLLQLRMTLTLPSGQTALLRLSDPRVLGNLLTVMTAAQQHAFFEFIDGWYFIYNDQRICMERAHA